MVSSIKKVTWPNRSQRKHGALLNDCIILVLKAYWLCLFVWKLWINGLKTRKSTKRSIKSNSHSGIKWLKFDKSDMNKYIYYIIIHKTLVVIFIHVYYYDHSMLSLAFWNLSQPGRVTATYRSGGIDDKTCWVCFCLNSTICPEQYLLGRKRGVQNTVLFEGD